MVNYNLINLIKEHAILLLEYVVVKLDILELIEVQVQLLQLIRLGMDKLQPQQPLKL